MRSVSILTVLLGIKLSIASPDPMITLSPVFPVEKRETSALSWAIPASCTSNWQVIEAISSLNNLPATMTIGKEEICSQVLQPTYYEYITNTLQGSTTKTKTISQTTSTTTTDPNSRTTTILCPTPSPSMLCGVAGTFSTKFLTENIFSHEPEGFVNQSACKQACLANNRCKSFVTYEISGTKYHSCDMYDAPLGEGILTRGGVANEGHWFDRGCHEFLPAACNSPNAKRGVAKRGRENLPSDLAKNYMLDFACSCVVTSASPSVTATVPRTLDRISKTTVWPLPLPLL
ncbi:uncharacterized protein BP5553_00825 [Venustampulla echinocandica]|uniref:Apple domain-containing protein n=1 Tax=Venustampulla echinocandica TaxID=2656787 RepID=A0A370TZ93_9HELO|nr:uncharacterized protein BP5553_00825 [Venustampulla echinocandica]RDL40846.1 hypothetical protein BP5553_00825 [Venustampulla echinocandica]